MTRDDLATYVATRHAQMAALVGYTDFLTPADQAFRAMGVKSVDLATAALDDDSQRPDAELLGDFYTLDALLLPLATFADIYAGDPKVSKQRSQIYKNSRANRDELKARLVGRGYAIDDTFSLGRVNLDFLEPYPVF